MRRGKEYCCALEKSVLVPWKSLFLWRGKVCFCGVEKSVFVAWKSRFVPWKVNVCRGNKCAVAAMGHRTMPLSSESISIPFSHENGIA